MLFLKGHPSRLAGFRAGRSRLVGNSGGHQRGNQYVVLNRIANAGLYDLLGEIGTGKTCNLCNYYAIIKKKPRDENALKQNVASPVKRERVMQSM